MKKLFVMFSLTTLFGLSAHAAGRPWLSCVNEGAMRSNVRISVKVTTADFSGLTEVHVERTVFSRRPSTTSQSYVVRNVSESRPGAPIVLRGNGVLLRANMTTSPRPGGGRPGLLALRYANGAVENIKLVCGR